MQNFEEAGFIKMVDSDGHIEFFAEPRGHTMLSKNGLRFIQRKSGMWFSEVREEERGNWQAIKGEFSLESTVAKTIDWLKNVGRGHMHFDSAKL